MIYYAHSRSGATGVEFELLVSHAQDIARLARSFAAKLHPILADWGYLVGLWHDIGKCTTVFQQRLQGGTICDHATSGARLTWNYITKGHLLTQPPLALIDHPQALALANCVVGHHGGLMDLISERPPVAPELYTSLTQRLTEVTPRVQTPYLPPELLAAVPALNFPLFNDNAPHSEYKENWIDFVWFHLTRMLFSCLIDADRLGSEQFTNPANAQLRQQIAGSLVPARLLPQLEQHISTLAERVTTDEVSATVNAVRQEILQACCEAAVLIPGLFTLTAPTGGGKTLASLSFALRHAQQYQKQRIIYVVPYITITDQIADEFNRIFGPNVVVEHHSNLDDLRPSSPLLTENWNAPIVVTTAVQFFESLYARRPGRCRKVHNIANSVIILDEAHMLPIPVLHPCVAVLRELINNYQCSIVLATATPPALQQSNDFWIGLQDARELVPLRVDHYQRMERVQIRNLGYFDRRLLAASLSKNHQALCVLNTRRDTYRLYKRIQHLPGCFHLSTFMCGAHRRQVLDQIRQRLYNKLPCLVISTSLIEAGIDIDFPVVYRAYAGLDSIAQAAGRCNRHGTLRDDQGELTPGEVFIFDYEGSNSVPDSLRIPLTVTRNMLPKYKNQDYLAITTMEQYFRDLYKRRQSSWDDHSVMKFAYAQKFWEVANRFQMIEPTHQIIVPYGNGINIIQEIQATNLSIDLLRQAQRFTVPIYSNEFATLRDANAIEIIDDDPESSVAVLVNSGFYDCHTGLLPW